MKLTIWEKNNIYNLLCALETAGVSAMQMHLLNDLCDKFVLTEQEEQDWNRFIRLSLKKNLPEDDEKFVSDYMKFAMDEIVEVKLKKRQFDFIAEYLLGDKVKMPSTRELRPYSIAMIDKIKKIQSDKEEI